MSYDLLKPQVTRLVVCDPRKDASMKQENKGDKIDACRLAELKLLILRYATNARPRSRRVHGVHTAGSPDSRIQESYR